MRDQTGATVTSQDLAGKTYLLWFYPKAATPGCTAEGNALRDSFPALQAAGVTMHSDAAQTVTIPAGGRQRVEWNVTVDDVQIGAPVVDGAKVVAEVVAQGRHDKIRIIKFRRRKHHMKRQGHRQWYTEIKITGIQA